MKIADLIPDFSAFKAKTNTALDETKAALATANNTISELSAKLEALASAKADDETAPAEDAPADDSSELDKFIADLQELISKYGSDESDDSTEDSDSTDESDATPDDSDDANDESASKATRAEKLKSLAKSVTKIVADNKKLKAELPKQVIREIAAVGIPTPIATKPDGKTTALKGLDRVAAAFSEQINNKK
jgi:hypothetical protein